MMMMMMTNALRICLFSTLVLMYCASANDDVYSPLRTLDLTTKIKSLECDDGEEFITIESTEGQWQICMPCPPGTFSKKGWKNCLPCNKCLKEQVIIQPCKASSDFICKDFMTFANLDECENQAVVTHCILVFILIIINIVAAYILLDQRRCKSKTA